MSVYFRLLIIIGPKINDKTPPFTPVHSVNIVSLISYDQVERKELTLVGTYRESGCVSGGDAEVWQDVHKLFS